MNYLKEPWLWFSAETELDLLQSLSSCFPLAQSLIHAFIQPYKCFLSFRKSCLRFSVSPLTNMLSMRALTCCAKPHLWVFYSCSCFDQQLFSDSFMIWGSHFTLNRAIRSTQKLHHGSPQWSSCSSALVLISYSPIAAWRSLPSSTQTIACFFPQTSSVPSSLKDFLLYFFFSIQRCAYDSSLIYFNLDELFKAIFFFFSCCFRI